MSDGLPRARRRRESTPSRPEVQVPEGVRTPSAPSADREAPTAPAPRLDGRRAHVLDRAAEYARLADQGLTAAQIARRRRKSKGHVSILLRLGRALAAVPDDERAALRSPRVTWRLVQGLVRADTDAASLRRQLRAAVGGFSTHNVDRRAPRARGEAAGRAPGVAWGWDAAWFARDPAGYADAHLAHLRHLHAAVTARAEQAVRARGVAGLDAGQSLRALQRRLARGPGGDLASAVAFPIAPPTDAERDALATFAAVGRALGAVTPSAPR